MEQDIKKLGLKALLDQGQVDKFLEYQMKGEESGNKSQLIGSIARIADMVTQHSEGVMVEAVTERIVKSLTKLTQELSKGVQKDLEDVEKELSKLTAAQNDKIKKEIVSRIESKLVEIEGEIKKNSDALLRGFFDDLMPQLRADARVTPEELDTIATNTANVVEGQLPALLRSYFRDVYIPTDRVTGLKELITDLIPEPQEIPKLDISKEQIRWNQIKDVPESIARNTGTGSKALKWLNDVDFTTEPTEGQALTYNATTKKWEPRTGSGSGDMLAANNLSDLTNASTARTNLGLGTMATETATNYVAKSLYDAHSVLYATADNTPAALTVSEQTLVGRATGGAIAAIAIDADLSAVSANDDTIPSAKATKAALDAKAPIASPSFTGTVTTAGSIELGHASDTTLSRASAGVLQVEGSTVALTTNTITLTNKRVTPRVGTTTSSATPTINTDNYDYYSLTAQTVDITSFTTNLSGTPTDGQKLWISVTGTAARAITWGASFEASTIALPTTTVTTNRLDVGFVWNTATSKWRCVASA